MIKKLFLIIALGILLAACGTSNSSETVSKEQFQQLQQIVEAQATQLALLATNMPNSTPNPTATPTPNAPTDMPVPTPTPTTSQPAAQPKSQPVLVQPTNSASQLAVPAGQRATSCPTEAEFTQLTGVVADVVPSEPCAFHWRGDPQTITPKNSCPEGWSCQLGVDGKGNILYYGGSPSVKIYAGTWRLVAAYPSNDAVQQPCQFLAKSQEEERQATPTWSITAGNFSCP
jgi:hypothetical protein